MVSPAVDGPGAERTPEAEPTTPPHVVMIVGNTVSNDTRVLKTATTLARAGARVTVLGYAGTLPTHRTALGAVIVLRVPVLFRLRRARSEGRARRRAWRPPVGYRTVLKEAAARERAELLSIDARRGGPLRRVRARSAPVVVTLGGAARRRWNGLAKRGWGVWDGFWARSTFLAHWRAIVPEADDYELGYGATLDALEPDAIHAHDVNMVGVASRAVARARAQGRDCVWVYDAHEWVPGLSRHGSRTKRVVAAWADLENEFIRDADRVMTVSPQLAVALQERYDLKALPDVVLNIPPFGAIDHEHEGIRETIGLPEETPLAVYSGMVQAARGVETAVEALALMPHLHVAVVAVPSAAAKGVQRLGLLAERLGVRERLHLLNPVEPHEVSAFLASADVGLIPLRHYGSHEMALANKLFEYLHAGLPTVVSDCAAQADFVTRYGYGVVHTADDPADLARAVTEALQRREELRAATRDANLRARYTWEGQEAVLAETYRDLLSYPLAPPTGETFAIPAETSVARLSGVTLGIGPANSAGQAWQWSKAVERNYPGVSTDVIAIAKDHYDYGRDVAVEPMTYAKDVGWAREVAERAMTRWTHALFEAGRPIFGTVNGRDFSGDSELLRASGLEVGLVFHGSEIREPRRHAKTHPFSPFRDSHDHLTARLQRSYEELAPLVDAFHGPKFVSTPDLLDYVPNALWLPVVIDTAEWTPQGPPLERPVPVVVHAPSNTILKGTREIESVLVPLADRGLITYRRIEGVPPSQVGLLLEDADIVVDQLLLGLYGVLACEGLALGRVVVGHVGDSLRSRVPSAVPVVEATPLDLGQVIERLLDDREAARAIAAEGPGFVAQFHDGRMSARVLHENLLSLGS